MALVSAGFKLTVTLVDSSIEDQATLTYMLTAADNATAVASTATIIGLLQAVTAAVVKGYNLSQVFIEDALVPPAGVEIENRAKVLARINNEPLKTATFYIPGAADGVFLAPTGPGRNEVDPTDADLIAYAGIWVDGTGLATISDGETLETGSSNGILGGERVHRASSRG